MLANRVGQFGLLMTIIFLKYVKKQKTKGQLTSIFLTIPVIGMKDIRIFVAPSCIIKETNIC